VTAVVTGGGRGIGRATALAFAARGHDVVVVGRAHDELEEVAAEIRRIGRGALALRCDVTSAADLATAAAETVRVFGAPTAVVANAGIVRRGLVHELSEDDWDDVVDVNLKGTFLTARAFLPAMLAAKTGRFVAIGSISSTLGTARQSAYCAAKWGVVGFVKSLAEELRGTGLGTLCILPGSVDTKMLEGSGFAPQMTAEEVAGLVVYAALDAPAAMNGSAVEMFGP
jgi:3-oxoacyl-[acyl-carrier protein] reductase